MAGMGFNTAAAAGAPPPPCSSSAASRPSASLWIPSSPGLAGDGSSRGSKTRRGRCSLVRLSDHGADVGAHRPLIARKGAPSVSSGGDGVQRTDEGGHGGGTEWESRLVRTLLIDNYDSYTYNIYQELSVVNGLPPIVVYNDDWTWEYACQRLYEEEAFDNIVISPGPGSPACPADIGFCLKILHECKDIPILGICLGHQALGYAHGARIIHAPEPVHGRLSEIEHAGCNLFLDIPCGSNSGFKRRARFSFMGGKGGPMWKQITFWLSDQSNKAAKGGGYLSSREANGEKKTMFLNDGFLDFLDKELQSFHYDKEDYQALPFDFCGGFVGFIGYGLKVECGASSNRHKSMMPDACFFFADNLLVVDHSNDDVYILSIHDPHCPKFRAAHHDTSETKTWMDETEKKLLGLISSHAKNVNGHKSSAGSSHRSKPKFVVAKSRHQYMKDVESCLKFIHDGESYELCLTTQMKLRVNDIDALAMYYSLRERNPAPYAAWLNFSKENLCILCSSPERFLQLDGNGTLEAKPIKGTIARGATLDEDDCLKFQLQHSEKDQAENLMIVDLLRNDLGRVCEPGSVHVPNLMKVESYATVHTLVSTIQGKKMQNLSPIDCVKAAFPGGSMTGAPKLRSMELLDTLECCSRGIYSGSIGFFSYNQRFDLNIVIRTVVIHEGEASIGAGGAVVALSNPEDEYEEMMLKARVPARVVEEYSRELGSENNLTSSSPCRELCGRTPLPLD